MRCYIVSFFFFYVFNISFLYWFSCSSFHNLLRPTYFLLDNTPCRSIVGIWWSCSTFRLSIFLPSPITLRPLSSSTNKSSSLQAFVWLRFSITHISSSFDCSCHILWILVHCSLDTLSWWTTILKSRVSDNLFCGWRWRFLDPFWLST